MKRETIVIATIPKGMTIDKLSKEEWEKCHVPNADKIIKSLKQTK